MPHAKGTKNKTQAEHDSLSLALSLRLQPVSQPNGPLLERFSKEKRNNNKLENY